MPDDLKNSPRSPDQLDEGLRGRVSGVTRIGPRAFLAGFLILFGLLLAVLYGVNRSSSPHLAAETHVPPPAPAPASDEPHFGANVPIVPSSAATEPPVLAIPTSVPDLSAQQNAQQNAQAPAAPSGPSQEELAAMQQREDEERRRKALYDSALKSPILTQGVQVAGAGTTSSDAAPAPGGDAGDTGFAGNGSRSAPAGSRAGGAPAAPAPAAPAYLNGPFGERAVHGAGVKIPSGGRSEDFLQSQRYAPVTLYELVASSVVPAALVTSVDSDLPGMIAAQVREDVYDSKTGKYLLIPKGTRLLGVYNSGVSFGQSRVLVAWQRMIFPDTSSIDLLNMPSSDVEGSAGVAGTVDNHDGRLFTAALLTSILSVGATLAVPQQRSVLDYPNPAQNASSAVAEQIANVGTSIVNRSLGVAPTLHIPKGYPFLVVVDRDIVFPGPYRGI